MTISKKSKIRNVVTSSFIRREEMNSIACDVPTYAPFDEPVKKPIVEKDICLLSKVEKKILRKINSLLTNNNITEPVYLDVFCKEIEHPVSTVKKTIQKLEKKGLIIRESFKAGRGGWSIYSLDHETRDKLEIN